MKILKDVKKEYILMVRRNMFFQREHFYGKNALSVISLWRYLRRGKRGVRFSCTAPAVHFLYVIIKEKISLKTET
ncbi:MAG: hypothetical protein IJR95_08760 [Lachnospiraceae bacterium]|nr:hypothetical protein [Lachnospiraceae bacterium]